MTWTEQPADQAPATGWGLKPATIEATAELSMAREVVQSFYLMGLMAMSLAFFLGLGLLAVWVLG
jgi:hypothetical protein